LKVKKKRIKKLVKNGNKERTKDLEIFKLILETIINLNHPLVKFAATIDWKKLEEQLPYRYSEKMGAPGKDISLTVGLQYLKYMHMKATRCSYKSL